MSKLSDYSKFDNLNDEDDDEDGEEETQLTASSAPTLPQQQSTTNTPTTTSPPTRPQPLGTIHCDKTHPERYYFQCNGQRVYDFQQDLDQVTIYVKPPPHVTKGSQIKCHIAPHHLKLGLVGVEEWYLNEDTFGTVDVDESTWSLEDDDDSMGDKVLCIYLTKANRGTLWDAALKGNAAVVATSANSTTASSTGGPTLNEFHKEQVKKDLMLQKFQEENPGFDFRGADFNGSVPDAREFMGGVGYD